MLNSTSRTFFVWSSILWMLFPLGTLEGNWEMFPFSIAHDGVTPHFIVLCRLVSCNPSRFSRSACKGTLRCDTILPVRILAISNRVLCAKSPSWIKFPSVSQSFPAFTSGSQWGFIFGSFSLRIVKVPYLLSYPQIKRFSLLFFCPWFRQSAIYKSGEDRVCSWKKKHNRISATIMAWQQHFHALVAADNNAHYMSILRTTTGLRSAVCFPHHSLIVPALSSTYQMTNPKVTEILNLPIERRLLWSADTSLRILEASSYSYNSSAVNPLDFPTAVFNFQNGGSGCIAVI